MDMNRRKVLVGLGAAAAGTGVVFGTGAFTQVEAERDVTVEVTDDSDAFLAIESESDFADDQGEAIAFDFEDVSEVEGEGLNPNARTEVTPLFSVTNQGSEEVEVTIDTGEAPDDGIEFTGLPETLQPAPDDPEDSVEVGVILRTGDYDNGDNIPNDGIETYTVTIEADADGV